MKKKTSFEKYIEHKLTKNPVLRDKLKKAEEELVRMENCICVECRNEGYCKACDDFGHQ